MPRSHTCPSCLTELARIRAVPDLHYGLPIVVCPKCNLACVRTKHPDQVFWRGVRRCVRSVRSLVRVIIFSVLSVGAMIGMSIWMIPVLTNRRGELELPVGIDPEEQIQLLVAIVIVALCGCIIRAVYAHQRFLVAWLLLMIPSLIFVSIDYTIGKLIIAISAWAKKHPDIRLDSLDQIISRYKVLLIFIIIATLGMFVGVLLNRIIAKGASKRVVRIRKKLRKRQARQD